MHKITERLLFCCAGAALTAGLFAFSLASARREKAQLAGRISDLQGQLQSARAAEAQARETARQAGTSNSALKTSLRESDAEVTRLNGIIAQRKLMPITVVRMKKPDGRFEYQLRNLGAAPLEIYISVNNPEQKLADPDYPKSRNLFYTLGVQRTFTFASYAGDSLSIASRGFADFKDYYP